MPIQSHTWSREGGVWQRRACGGPLSPERAHLNWGLSLWLPPQSPLNTGMGRGFHQPGRHQVGWELRAVPTLGPASQHSPIGHPESLTLSFAPAENTAVMHPGEPQPPSPAPTINLLPSSLNHPCSSFATPSAPAGPLLTPQQVKDTPQPGLTGTVEGANEDRGSQGPRLCPQAGVEDPSDVFPPSQ